MDLEFHGVDGGSVAASTASLPAVIDHDSGAVVHRTPHHDERASLARAWLEAYENDSVHTRAAYERDIRTYFGWADENGADVFALIPAAIDQYRRFLQQEIPNPRYVRKTRRSNATVARMLTSVSSFYKYGQTNRHPLVRWNPAEHVRRPKPPKVSNTVGLSPEDTTKMLDVARRWGKREYALFMVLAGTGVRVTEAINLDTGDLVREGVRWYLQVVRKGGDEGLVGVPEPVARAIRRYQRGRRGALFLDSTGAERMTRRQAAHLVAKAAREVFGPNGPKISPHSFRHALATRLLNEGESISNVQALMGHTTIATTARYDRALRERNNPAVDRMALALEDGMPDVEVSR